MVTKSANLSAVEEIKRTSAHLRGDLATELVNSSPRVSSESEQLMKFHGIYAQDNRDVRRERSQAGEDLDYIFMIRVAIPGGHLNTDQWLALDRVAEELTDGSIRLTTRQAVQFHGARKERLQPLARSLHEHLMTSFGACGDVVRNIVTCPELQTNDPNGRLAEATEHFARAFKSRSQAYWEIFVNGEKAASQGIENENEFYGETYLPRKFKIAIAHPDENCVDIFAQDCGLIPGTHPDHGDGFTVVVGGGLGRSYANPNTFARLANPLTFATYGEIDGVIAAILTTYRDLGDRSDRRHARMKYIVEELGIDGFREEVVARYGSSLRPPLAIKAASVGNDHLGWTELPNGDLQLGIRVGAGRVKDIAGGGMLRSALRHLATNYPVNFYITAQQDILIANIPRDAREKIENLMATHQVRLAEQLGTVERNALACPALPTCGQALAESERRLPEMIDQIEALLRSKGLQGRRLQLRMTGCPNGCARPGLAEVGIVGRTKSTYDLFLGGGPRGDRLATLYREKVKFDEVPAILDPILGRWHDEGLDEEAFGDFFERAMKP